MISTTTHGVARSLVLRLACGGGRSDRGASIILPGCVELMSVRDFWSARASRGTSNRKFLHVHVGIPTVMLDAG